jgi:hypothetical protein
MAHGAVPVVLALAAARVGATPRSRNWGIEVRRRDQHNTRLRLPRRRCIPYALACKQAPLSAAVNTAKLGCAARAVRASFLCASLSAAMNTAKLGCAARALSTALMRLLSASVTFTHAGCAARAVWLTSRMRPKGGMRYFCLRAAALPCGASRFDCMMSFGFVFARGIVGNATFFFFFFL